MTETREDEVALNRAKYGGRTARRQAPASPAPPPIPRITRLMALAIKFQDMVNSGEVNDYADLARLGYADLDVPMLARMFDRRCRGYEAVGYTIVLPGSAIPGWPASVPLPADPEWKRDYAASVRRLVRDGVDPPLGSLFVDAARPFPLHADGVERARSATEASLYRRLETLADTHACFRLNAGLPIPFDELSTMEVDLLCDDARVVVELDGAQHLANPAAYRRDRRKDRLLQENGYLVLRFLAEDVSQDLDSVLDAILRALAHRRRVFT